MRCGWIIVVILLLLGGSVSLPGTEAATKVDVWISQEDTDWLRVSWDPSQDGDKFSRYEVFIDKGNGFEQVGDPIFNIDTTNMKVTGLKQDTEYKFKVRDWDTDGLHEDSDIEKGKTEVPGFEILMFLTAIALALLLVARMRRKERRREN